MSVDKDNPLHFYCKFQSKEKLNEKDMLSRQPDYILNKLAESLAMSDLLNLCLVNTVLCEKTFGQVLKDWNPAQDVLRNHTLSSDADWLLWYRYFLYLPALKTKLERVLLGDPRVGALSLTSAPEVGVLFADNSSKPSVWLQSLTIGGGQNEPVDLVGPSCTALCQGIICCSNLKRLELNIELRDPQFKAICTAIDQSTIREVCLERNNFMDPAHLVTFFQSIHRQLHTFRIIGSHSIQCTNHVLVNLLSQMMIQSSNCPKRLYLRLLQFQHNPDIRQVVESFKENEVVEKLSLSLKSATVKTQLKFARAVIEHPKLYALQVRGIENPTGLVSFLMAVLHGATRLRKLDLKITPAQGRDEGVWAALGCALSGNSTLQALRVGLLQNESFSNHAFRFKDRQEKNRRKKYPLAHALQIDLV